MSETNHPTRPAADAAPRRRGFLAALGGAAAAAPAVAAAAAEPARSDALPSGAARKEGEAEKLRARYRETDHVRAFYQTNRY